MRVSADSGYTPGRRSPFSHGCLLPVPLRMAGGETTHARIPRRGKTVIQTQDTMTTHTTGTLPSRTVHSSSAQCVTSVFMSDVTHATHSTALSQTFCGSGRHAREAFLRPSCRVALPFPDNIMLPTGTTAQRSLSQNLQRRAGLGLGEELGIRVRTLRNLKIKPLLCSMLLLSP